MWKDPIVEELRKQRLKIEADCENDFQKIFEQAMKTQQKFVTRLISKPALQKESTEMTSEVR
jgi:hypothetical protein